MYEKLFREEGIELVVAKVRERLEEDELLQWAQDMDGVICGDDRFTAKVLHACSRLKVISKWGTGVDSIDREEAGRLGVAVYNTPDAFTDPVADTVMAYVLGFARRIVQQDREMRNGRWEKIPCGSLRECVLGVIGVGNIGRAVVQRAIAFGMQALGNDTAEIAPSFLHSTGLRLVSKDELLACADFVTLNCGLNPTSRNLICEREFHLMKPTAYLINTARGDLVDEPALIRALRERRIAGAALDVFEIEPLPASSPLLSLENCLLAPHTANSSPMAARMVHEKSIRNLITGLKARLA
jgi:D-3-phosphoglycerate dehydrogenase